MIVSVPSLEANLRRLKSEGGDANRLVVEGARGWVAVWGPKGGDRWTVVVSAGRQLPEGVKLPAERAQLLYDQGFRQRTAASPYRLQVDPSPLSAQILDVFASVLETEAERADLRLGDAPTTVNERLVDRMRAAARDRSVRARNRLYHGLVRAHLLVATQGPPSGADSALAQHGTLGARPVSTAYTDWHSALAHDARGPHVEPMRGMDLFPLLAARKAGALQLNPAGPVGGELYAHELWTIAEGCKRLSGVH